MSTVSASADGRLKFGVRLPATLVEAFDARGRETLRARSGEMQVALREWLEWPRKKGRPDPPQPKDIVRISLRLPPEMIASIDKVAVAEQRTRERQVERALREWLEKRA